MDGEEEVASFDLPEEFADNESIGKFKGEDGKVKVDDFVKGYVEQSKLVGKKATAFDYETATENEIKDYVDSKRPEKAEDYNVSEDKKEGLSEQELEFGRKMLHDLGVSKYTGNKILDTFASKQSEIKTDLFNKKGFETELQESFKDKGDWEKVAGETANLIKSKIGRASCRERV